MLSQRHKEFTIRQCTSRSAEMASARRPLTPSAGGFGPRVRDSQQPQHSHAYNPLAGYPHVRSRCSSGV